MIFAVVPIETRLLSLITSFYAERHKCEIILKEVLEGLLPI